MIEMKDLIYKNILGSLHQKIQTKNYSSWTGTESNLYRKFRFKASEIFFYQTDVKYSSRLVELLIETDHNDKPTELKNYSILPSNYFKKSAVKHSEKKND